MSRSDTDQTSPQATANGFRDAMIAGDVRRAFCYLTPKAQFGMVAAAYIDASFRAGAESSPATALHKLTRKYALPERGLKDRDPAESLTILRALLKWNARHMPPDNRLDLALLFRDTAYSGFRIADERAYAIATQKGRPSEVRFVCIDGCWFFL